MAGACSLTAEYLKSGHLDIVASSVLVPQFGVGGVWVPQIFSSGSRAILYLVQYCSLP